MWTWRAATALGMVASLFRTTWGMTWWASVPWRWGWGHCGWVESTKACGVSEQVVECLVSSADPDGAPKNLPIFRCPGFESSKSRGEVHWDVISSFINSEPWAGSVRLLGHFGRPETLSLEARHFQSVWECHSFSLCSLCHLRNGQDD